MRHCLLAQEHRELKSKYFIKHTQQHGWVNLSCEVGNSQARLGEGLVQAEQAGVEEEHQTD